MFVKIFWLLTILCVLCALCFVLPPIWLAPKDQTMSKLSKYSLSGVFILILPLMAYLIYAKLGAGQDLPAYYAKNAVKQRENNILMRPLYSRLQRELVKNKLNIQGDKQNFDLIINFATIHSKLADGYLQADIKSLLETLLKGAPQQVTILNLLAVDAYKSGDYTVAIQYWTKILQQITPDMQATEAKAILNAKIAEAMQLESRRT